mmetsp:Transcript_32156/g.113078  ORF Transcript_32156/g.113078 Transcript_32156/m.113078 type:complete len:385 (-) Transcript_32156:494-1648(-)
MKGVSRVRSCLEVTSMVPMESRVRILSSSFCHVTTSSNSDRASKNPRSTLRYASTSKAACAEKMGRTTSNVVALICAARKSSKNFTRARSKNAKNRGSGLTTTSNFAAALAEVQWSPQPRASKTRGILVNKKMVSSASRAVMSKNSTSVGEKQVSTTMASAWSLVAMPSPSGGTWLKPTGGTWWKPTGGTCLKPTMTSKRPTLWPGSKKSPSRTSFKECKAWSITVSTMMVSARRTKSDSMSRSSDARTASRIKAFFSSTAAFIDRAFAFLPSNLFAMSMSSRLRGSSDSILPLSSCCTLAHASAAISTTRRIVASQTARASFRAPACRSKKPWRASDADRGFATVTRTHLRSSKTSCFNSTRGAQNDALAKSSRRWSRRRCCA